MGHTSGHLVKPIRRAAIAATCLGVLIAAPSTFASRGSTATGSTNLPEATKQSAAAKCPARTHASGGGFTVNPVHEPSSGVVGSYTQRSTYSSARDWSVSTGAFSPGADSSTLTALVRCERRVDSQVAVRFSIKRTIEASSNPATVTGSTLGLVCPPQTRASGGGFSSDSPFANNFNAVTTVVVQSRRTARRVWSTTWFLRGGATAEDQDVTAYVICESANRRRITVARNEVPYPEDDRASALALCPRGRHVVSGGFIIEPLSGSVPIPFVDYTAPSGNRQWRVETYDSPQFLAPDGATLTAEAYCRRNKLPRRRRAARTAESSAAPAGEVRVYEQPIWASVG